MKNFRIVVLILLLAIAAPLVRHHAWALGSPQLGVGTAQGVQPSALHILSPKPNEKLAQTFVTVQYQQVASASASSTPTYELRLDGRDPVQITDMSYTFNGLTPGTHDLIVQVVDANGAPVTGTRSEVKFVSVNPSSPQSKGSVGQAANLPSLPLPQAPSNNDLPNGNSSLPLLSVIGFGILVGGVISALRTRPAHK
jgi:hypothetical protein